MNVFLVSSSVLEQMKKKKKKIWCRIVFGLLPKLYYEKKKLVLQDNAMYCDHSAVLARVCIAILKLYCKKQERRLWDCIARWVNLA